jgi:hypothetical protein
MAKVRALQLIFAAFGPFSVMRKSNTLREIWLKKLSINTPKGPNFFLLGRNCNFKSVFLNSGARDEK